MCLEVGTMWDFDSYVLADGKEQKRLELVYEWREQGLLRLGRVSRVVRCSF